MKKTIELKGVDLQTLLGVAVRGSKIKLDGKKNDVEAVHEIIHEMIQTLSRKGTLTKKDVSQLVNVINAENGNVDEVPKDVIHYGRKGAIVPRTSGQKKYVKIVNDNDIVFSVGPAGTGKTFIAVAFAIAALENHDVDRSILCRPAVEAGESLGFLPGDLKEKVDPYLTPLYDSLHEMMPGNKLKPLLNKNIE